MPELPREEKWMLLALKEAEAGITEGERPVGAVILNDATGMVRARAPQQTRTLEDPTAHAAMIALTQLAGSVSDGMTGEDPPLQHDHTDEESLTMVLTQEPCVMCAGAILLHPSIRTLIYGAPKREFGACGTAVDVFGRVPVGKSITVLGGVLHDPCRMLLERHSTESGNSPSLGGTPR